MEEVKKNKKKNKVASLLLALALILTCGVAGTIAQYQKTLGGQSTAQVAKFKVSAGNLNEAQNAQLNLFNTIKESDGTSAEDHVTDGKIAPGTTGSIPMTVTNESDVKVKYSLSASLNAGTGVLSTYTDADGVAVTNAEIPLEFALSTSTTLPTTGWVTIGNLASDQNASSTLEKASNGAQTKPLYLYWRWAMTDGDQAGDAAAQKKYKNRNLLDTAIGEAIAGTGTATFTNPQVTVSITFEQVHN